MSEVYIYTIFRVPSGKKGGMYKKLPPERLVSFLLNKLALRGLEFFSGEVILANSVGTQGNPTRNAVLGSSLSPKINAATMDAQCGGSYKSIEVGHAYISSGMKEWVICGGFESTSLQPTRIYHKKDPRYTHQNFVKAEFAPFPTLDMHEAAGQMILDHGIGVKEMLQFTFSSHQKAKAFYRKGIFNTHVLPYWEAYEWDEPLQKELTMRALERTSTRGLINASNTAGYHDGAGIVLLGSKKFGMVNGLQPLAKINGNYCVGGDPNYSPQMVLTVCELVNLNRMDLIEICESFAVKPLAVQKVFGLKPEKLNFLGGNLAMGHPYAASGVLNLLNLYLGLKEIKGKRGFVAAGAAGGLGLGLEIELC